MDLREKRDVGAEIVSLDRGAHPGASGADDEHVVCRFHCNGSYRMQSALALVRIDSWRPR
jgi:hypothetical protein